LWTHNEYYKNMTTFGATFRFVSTWLVLLLSLTRPTQGQNVQSVDQISLATSSEEKGLRGNRRRTGIFGGSSTYVKYVLYNALTKQKITDLVSGSIVDLYSLGLSSTKNLNIEAVVSSSSYISYVRLSINSNYVQNDYSRPYNLCGSSGCYSVIRIGNNYVSAIPYGWSGYSLTYHNILNFEIIAGRAPTPSPISLPTKAPITPPNRVATRQPSNKPITQKPTNKPITRTPTNKPITRTPTNKPITRTPTNKPITHAPTNKPITRAPTTRPVTSTQTPISTQMTPAPQIDPKCNLPKVIKQPLFAIF
jgi:hypothetical protein